ncbi:MAG: hypothetical protein E6G97_02170 [Alphaproteobacteria bacterium]|nr:MAG: hypothetical protein E6G97_02170 [Alphaproteobacteria bacterium]
MTPARPLLSLLAGLALAYTLAPEPAAARTNYDGNWSVLIVTNSGPCDRAYRYGLSIRNGRVSYEGSAAVNVEGRVAPNGAVRVRVWAGSQSASGAGRLSNNYGSGMWQGAGSASSCAGSWTAERR